MNGAFFGVFAVAALVLAWLEPKAEGSKPSWHGLVATVVGIGVLICGAMSQGLTKDLPLEALIASVFAIALVYWRGNPQFAMIGAGALAAHSLMPATAQVAEVSVKLSDPIFISLAVVGWVGACLAWSGAASGGVIFSGSAALVVMANRWTPEGFGKIPNSAGSMLAIAILAAAVIVLLIQKGKAGAGSMLAGGLGAAIVAMAGLFIGQWGGDDMTLPVTIFAAVLASFVVCWMTVSERDTGRLVLGGLIWMGVATMAFAQDKSFGLAMACLAGLATFALFGKVTLSSVLGPVIGLLSYRTFRLVYPDITRAYDIAQHYGMVSSMIGVGIMILLLDRSFMGKNRSSMKGWFRFAITGVIGVTACLVGLMFFGTKGGVGLLVGLGLGAWVTGLIDESRGFGLIPLIGLTGVIGVSYGAISESFELARDEKMRVFLIASSVLVVLAAIAVFGLSERQAKVEAPVETA
ncbi:MAG: hypothetical protein KF824_03160 [Fimbriimonadaceae bacterium]|nr:MAG: hypothetical protein KF824_03160 [Fimbriimonadaceae bacterium]